MKKFLLALVIILLLFLGLTYWSVSIGPEEVIISRVVEPLKPSEDLRQGEKVEVIASNRYRANALKRFMQGENYRTAWEAPVKAEVFLLDSFDILEEGGGNQTKSLDLKDKAGRIYSLRSINKDPEPLIPKVARTLNLENIVIDGISAQHPYGAVLAASLSDAVGILNTRPKIVYVPEHKAMGKYTDEYGNRLFLLEFETEGDINWTSIENVQEIVETDKLQEMKAEMGDRLKVDYRRLVRARLFDLLIGDWDRHSKQWGWVLQRQGENLMAIPLPGDRDNAFFRIDGVLPTILTNHLVQPMVRPFEEDIDHIPGYVYPFDLYFLKEVPKEVFLEEAKYLQQELTNTRIDKALQQWPEKLVELNGKEIKKKLTGRREKLQDYAGKFYDAIQKRERSEKPLKGSEDLKLPQQLHKCFECE